MEPENLAASAQEEIWRKEVQARVTGYRSRKGRRIEGAFSMRFPFPSDEVDTDVHESPIASPVPTSDVANEIAECEPAIALPAEESMPLPSAPDPRSARDNLIAFPRPVVAEPAPRDLEPLLPEQPRIFDVPEEFAHLPSTPLLDGLQFRREAKPAETQRDHVELPLQPVALARRMQAAVVDFALTLAAAGLFAGVAVKLLPKLALTKPLLMAIAVVPGIFWVVYQYLFVIYNGRTAGMRIAGICLTTFKGGNPTWRQRRTRVVGLYFSAASLMMGLLWSLVDINSLCWHDRISETYMTEVIRT